MLGIDNFGNHPHWANKSKIIASDTPLRKSHLSTAVAWREKKFKHFVFNKYFCLVLGEKKWPILLQTLNYIARNGDNSFYVVNRPT